MSHTWPEVLSTLVAGDDLSAVATRWVAEEMLSAQIAGFAVGLRAKGESLAEVQSLAEVMYEFAAPLEISARVVDIVGTGGDRANTVNISTMSAIVIAGAGVPVVKHGNRAASSASGSADVLEALGVNLDLPIEHLPRVGAPRRELGIATVFNFLGPLTNPARPAASAVGCADARMAPLMAGVLAGQGVDAWVFRGDDGLDEITTTTTSTLWLSGGAETSQHVLDPRDVGIGYSPLEALKGGDAAYNAGVVHQLLAGEKSAVRDAVVMNAGAALAAFAQGPGAVVEQWQAGIKQAEESLDSGAAASVLDRWVNVSNNV